MTNNEAPKVIISGTQSLEAALKETGTYVVLGDGREFYFLPYWFEKIEHHSYIMHDLDKLPEDLKECIQEEREEENE